MDWMLTHQLSSKNLSVGEKLAMTEEFQEEVRLENEKKKLDGNKLGAAITNGESVSLQLECEREKKHSETWTDSQIAKKAGVSTRTVARYDTVMNSDNKELQQSMYLILIMRRRSASKWTLTFFLFLYQLQSKYNSIVGFFLRSNGCIRYL